MGDLRRVLAVTACTALTFVLGTIHAFSVFLPEWENLPGADRASASLVYSLALVSLTVAVLFSYRLFAKLNPPAIFLLAGIGAATGLALAARSSTLIELYLWYGLLFGGANGIGYGYALQLSGQTMPAHRGFAMGLVTAFYAVGATLAPSMFVWLIDRAGNALALNVMAAITVVVAALASLVLYGTRARYTGEVKSAVRVLCQSKRRVRFLLWVSYGSAVAAGLMVIGHAYGLAIWLNHSPGFAIYAPTAVALGNMLGGFSAGFFSDRLSSVFVLRWLPVVTAAGLSALVAPFDANPVFQLLALCVTGYCYGALIAVYPVAVIDVFGTASAARIYGQVFTAWGLAGLLGPWLSGWVFDQTDSYRPSLLIAIGLSLVSSVAIRQCLSKPASHSG